tara:strand:+ start:44 stop:511 length:468 start_codon:yes stop_codon:yes gene_type:complete
MTLKVIRYKNYGCTLTGGGSPDNWEDKFYFSFYELNNGNIIELDLFQSFKDDELILSQYDFSNTKVRLKSGKVREYKFGKAKADDNYAMADEFFKWFDSYPTHIEVKDYYIIEEIEEKCVKDFYLLNIEPTKDIKTDTTEVKVKTEFYDSKNKQS